MDPRERRAARNKRGFGRRTAALNASRAAAGYKTHVRARARGGFVGWSSRHERPRHEYCGGRQEWDASWAEEVPSLWLAAGWRRSPAPAGVPSPVTVVTACFETQKWERLPRGQTVQSHWDCGSNSIGQSLPPGGDTRELLASKRKQESEKQSVKKLSIKV